MEASLCERVTSSTKYLLAAVVASSAMTAYANGAFRGYLSTTFQFAEIGAPTEVNLIEGFLPASPSFFFEKSLTIARRFPECSIGP